MSEGSLVCFQTQTKISSGVVSGSKTGGDSNKGSYLLCRPFCLSQNSVLGFQWPTIISWLAPGSLRSVLGVLHDRADLFAVNLHYSASQVVKFKLTSQKYNRNNYLAVWPWATATQRCAQWSSINALDWRIYSCIHLSVTNYDSI